MTKSYHLMRSRTHRLSSNNTNDGLWDMISVSDKMPRKRNVNGISSSTRSSKSVSKPATSKTPHSSHTLMVIYGCCLVILAILLYEYQHILISSFGNLKFYLGIDKRNSPLKPGGWRLADADTLKLYNTSICTIDRQFAHEINEHDFENIYRHKKPLILCFKNGADDWTLSERWSIESLQKEYGDWDVMSGNSREIVRHGGTGYIQASFSNYIEDIMYDKDSVGEPMYIFDRDFYNDSSLPSTLKPPKYLKIEDGVDDSIFFLGMSGSGVSFHKHADAWNGVIYGRKRWFLFPLEKTPPGGVYPGFTQQEWYRRIYPLVKPEDKMLECIQEAGEILYLPESWYHGTINLGDTVAIGIQKKEANTHIEKLFYREGKVAKTLRNKNRTEKLNIMKERLKILEEILHLLPDSAEVNMKVGTMYKDIGNLHEAKRFTDRALELDQNFVVALLNLAGIESQLGNMEAAIEHYKQSELIAPNLWDVYAQYGDFLLNNGQASEAVVIYKKGTVLEPDFLPLWTQLRHAQLMAEDKQGAESSLKEINRIKNN
ncbi:hypothetical protein ACF0H5_014378 [Mactra antiquata]